jgi:signal transduction histidine kinase
VQFYLKLPELYLPAVWVGQFYLLLGLSLALSVSRFLLRHKLRLALTLMFLQLVLVAVLGLPIGFYLGVEFTLYTALVAQSVGLLEPPMGWIAASVQVAVALALQQPVQAWGRQLSRPENQDLLTFGLSLTVLLVLAALLRALAGRYEGQQREIHRLGEATHQLISANVGFQQYADVVGLRSAADERKRITREIHDTVGYTLINIMMILQEAALHSTGDEALCRLHAQALEQAQTGLNETRRALRLLRDTEGPPLQVHQEIRRIAGAFESATGVRVGVEYGNLPGKLGEEQRDFIFHLLQEGMANAFRHGQATRIRVTFWQDERQLIVNLSDNGSGSAVMEEGIGLSGMKERANKLGAEFSACNILEGFQITARIPVGEGNG